MPDLPGDLVIDAASRRRFRSEMVGVDPLIVRGGVIWQRVSIGRRRPVADGTMRRVSMRTGLALGCIATEQARLRSLCPTSMRHGSDHRRLGG